MILFVDTEQRDGCDGLVLQYVCIGVVIGVKVGSSIVYLDNEMTFR